ncbi:PfkB family carbohydrate kinase [Paludibacterium yongneupense]|uniref:PfkB family carbohydrate kinase n=1 Tax=Paludibacterium yongneupense TaxID=400061 RepID=UPI0004091D2D|nr:PfkB family carbohydrate kinase [Paludibacterium yongneupense]
MGTTESRANRYAVVIGDANLDITGTPDVAMRSRMPHPGSIRTKPGGCARNVAENLARLGCDTRLVSVFGDDADGRELMAVTLLTGVDLSPSRIITATPTANCLLVYDGDGEIFCTVGDVSIVSQITPERLQEHSALLQDAALIVVNTVLPAATLAYLCEHYGDRPLFVDTIDALLADRIRPWLARVHTLKPNRAEASQLSGLPFGSREDAAPVAAWFHRAGVAHVVLSLGEYGLYYSNGADAGWMTPPQVTIANTTGAGDALMAGLAYGWLQGLPFVETTRFALGCAALTLTCDDNTHPALSAQAVGRLLQEGAPPSARTDVRLDAARP